MKQKGFAPILIIVLVALVFGGFLIYQKQTKSISQQSSSIQCKKCLSSVGNTCSGNYSCFIPNNFSEGVCLPVLKPGQKYTIEQVDKFCATDFIENKIDKTIKTAITPIKTLASGNVSLKDIKYILPKGWKAVMNNGLSISPDQGGGFLSIRSYDYPGNIDSKKYYCQLSKVCIEGTTYYEEKKIGNISGYRALALDNSGGGPDYFGFKGNKFYIISTFTPPFPNEFEAHFLEVLNSLVF